MKVRKYEGVRMDAAGKQLVDDYLAVEHPLEISINNAIWMITMQTPGDEENLIRGLLFTEGVYKDRSEDPLYQIRKTSDEGFVSEINVVLNEQKLSRSEISKRSLLSAASCGICGTTALKHLDDLPRIAPFTAMNGEVIHLAFKQMRAKQSTFDHSGGSHAAAICAATGEIIAMQEDIGRHNAVDKCVGLALSQRQLDQAKLLLVSGRVSYEIITKCFIAGIPVLAAVSAPSTLAVDFAKELGVTLFGFCRENRMTRYT